MKDKKNCRHGSYSIDRNTKLFKCQFCGTEFSIDAVDKMIYNNSRRVSIETARR